MRHRRLKGQVFVLPRGRRGHKFYNPENHTSSRRINPCPAIYGVKDVLDQLIYHLILIK